MPSMPSPVLLSTGNLVLVDGKDRAYIITICGKIYNFIFSVKYVIGGYSNFFCLVKIQIPFTAGINIHTNNKSGINRMRRGWYQGCKWGPLLQQPISEPYPLVLSLIPTFGPKFGLDSGSEGKGEYPLH